MRVSHTDRCLVIDRPKSTRRFALVAELDSSCVLLWNGVLLDEYRRTTEVQVRSSTEKRDGRWRWSRCHQTLRWCQRRRRQEILEMAKVGKSVSETSARETLSSGSTGKCRLLFAGCSSRNGVEGITIDDLAAPDGVERVFQCLDARFPDFGGP